MAVMVSSFPIFALSVGAAPAEPAGARAFIAAVYSHYPRRSPSAARERAATFEPGLLALLRKSDERGPDEVGPLDGDPICQCQDDSGFRHDIVRVSGTRTHARAVVRNIFAAPALPSEMLVTYQLVRTSSGWRIYDIGSKDQPSFRAWLRSALAEQR